MILRKLLWLSVLTITISSVADAQTKSVFKENNWENKFDKRWLLMNGVVQAGTRELQISKDRNWAILLNNTTLPENYILTFSTRVEPGTYLFELMLNLSGQHFLGILNNQLESRVAIEDRSLFANPDKVGSYIHTTGHVGLLPKVELPAKFEAWQDWRVQKSGNQVFVWINGEEIITFKDTKGIMKAGGQFGFAVNGKASVSNVQLFKAVGDAAMPPLTFKGKPPVRTWFVFE
ncbi:hypothetical protein [Pedobacter antarcticus]|uniref:hypothetical protein n=1 Tax=Pedobacter antarcticus TaxID=34086 RepID=UPI001C5843A2|nr:hypothetical protein [Pedobacter antarcticus]